MITRFQLKGLSEAGRALDAKARRQVPFVLAVTLTHLAKASQAEIRERVLPRQFILRRAAWAKAGIRIRPATKQRLESEVADINPYMLLQETGGTKLPFGRFIAVPLRGARRSQTSVIRAEDRPAAVMKAGGFIRGNVMFRAAQVFKKQRRRRGMVGPVNAQRQRNRVMPMYALVPKASVRAVYAFAPTVQRVVGDQYQRQFDANWSKYAEGAR